MNAYRCRLTGNLDRQYLRVCAVYRLLDRQRIEKARAVELLKARNVKPAQAVVEMWLAEDGPLSEKGRRSRDQWRASQEAA
jgi:hypothetical protein